ncbi:MAG: YbaK/EbsC family protein [Anaerolineales bacterium]|nr:YbaK/EbsC family protein [Anaerolineales bacterium]
MEKTPVGFALEKLNIPHEVFTHSDPVHSLEEAASQRGQRPSQIVRSILFRVGEAEFVLGLVAGPAQISWKALRKYLGQSRLTLATEEEVLVTTGYQVGAVGPLGLLKPVRVLVEAQVLNEAEISIGSGIRNVAILLKSQDLIRALDAPEIVRLVEL